MHRTLAVLLPLHLLLWATPSTADDWPSWLGPARDGISRERDWSSRGAPEPLWRAEVGLGYSCVTVVDGRLYTLGHDEAAQEDSVLCLDALTGEEQWRFTYPAETAATFHGGGTLTTPVFDDGRLVVTDREGRVFCLAAEDGSVVWQRNLAEELSIERPTYGFSPSALALDDQLVVVMGGNVLGLERTDGATLWQALGLGTPGYATPVPFELRGRPALAVFLGEGLVVLDGASGEELHRFPFQGESGSLNAGTPIVMGERVLVSSAFGAGAALLQLVAGRSEPEVVWRSRRMRNKVSGVFLWQDHLYGFDESMLKCLDVDGNERWRVRGLGMGALSVAGGRLLVLSSKGELIVAEATPEEFRELSRAKVLDGGVYWTMPVLVDGRIYCRSSLGSLVCLDHRSVPAAAAAAGSESPEGPPPEATALFAGHLAAVGGAAAFEGLRSLRLTGEFESASSGITRCPMTLERALPDRWRREYDLGQFGKVVHAYDGEVGWQLDPFYGNEVFADARLREAAETGLLDGALHLGELYPEATTLGPADFGGRACWAVQATSRGGAQRHLYFDRASGLWIGRDGEHEGMVVHADYRDFGGLRLAAYTRVLDPDTGEEDRMWIASAERNVVAEGAFERPPEVLRLLRTPEEIEAANEALRARHGRLLGTYVGDHPPTLVGDVVIAVQDGDVVFQLPSGPPLVLVEPEDGATWGFAGRPGLSLSPVEDERGAVTGIVVQVGEERYELPRKPD